GAHKLGAGNRNIQQNGPRRGKEAVNVLLQLEHPAVIRPQALEDAVTIKQAVVEDGYFCVPLVVIFPVNMDLHSYATQNYGKTTAPRNHGLEHFPPYPQQIPPLNLRGHGQFQALPVSVTAIQLRLPAESPANLSRR